MPNTLTKPPKSFFALTTYFYNCCDVDGRTYFRDGDDTNYPLKWDANDTEDPTDLDDTLSMSATNSSGAGYIVPCDCTLVKVAYQFAEVGNVDGDQNIYTMHTDPPHASSGTWTWTLKHATEVNATSMGTTVNRKSFKIAEAPDTSVSQDWDAGDVVALAFYSNDGGLGSVKFTGSATWLFEIRNL